MARILLVQDDADLATALHRQLLARGHQPELVQTAGGAVRAFEASTPDLVVAALVLPDSSGLVLISRIRGMRGGRQVPVILTSQVYRAAEVEASQLSRLGVRYFLAKPFSVADVLRRIDRLVKPPLPEALREDRSGSTGSTQEIDVAALGLGQPKKPAPPPEPAPPVPAATQEISLDIGRPTTGTHAKPSAPAHRNLPPRVNSREVFGKTVADLFHAHDSGELKLASADCDRTFYFLNGYPVWLDVDPPLLGCVEWLHAQGHLTEDQMVAAAAAQTRLSWGVSRVLVSQQVFKPDELEPLLQAWVEHELQQAVGRTGTLSFAGGDAFAESIPVYEFNPISCLWGVIEKTLRLGAAEIGLVSVEDKYLRRRGTHDRLFGYVATSSVLQELREWLTTGRHFDSIREYFSASWEEVARCLWFLVHTQVVAVTDYEPEDEITSFGSIPVVDEGGFDAGAEPTARFSREMIAKLVAQVGERQAADTAAEAPPEQSDDPEVRVIRHYVTRMEMDHYAFLEVGPEDDEQAIQDAFDRAAGWYRPTSLPDSATPEVRRKAKELLARAARAYGVLTDQAARRAYDAGLGEDQATGHWDSADIEIDDEDSMDGVPPEIEYDVEVDDDEDDEDDAETDELEV